MIVIISQITALVTVILLLIFAILILTLNKRKTNSNFLLTAFLLSNAFYIIAYIIDVAESTLGISLPLFTIIGTGFGFLFGPLLYFFTYSITVSEYKFYDSRLWHFIPFILYFIVKVFYREISWMLISGIMNIQIIPYMIACLVLILNYRREIANYFSSLQKINLSWLIYVSGGFLVMWMIDLSTFIMIDIDSSLINAYRILTFISILINLIFIVLLFFKAVQSPQFIVNIIEENKIQKYGSSKLSTEEKEDILSKVLYYFESEKPYLNPELTIQDVANTIGINIKYISQVINENLHKNFHDLVNSYRISEAKNKLANETERERTILEILYDSGFNSKTTFNTAFKKHTGITPTQYRLQNFSSQ